MQRDLMSFEAASSRLGLNESEIGDLVDAGKLTLCPYVGDVYLDGDEVRALAAERRPKTNDRRREAALPFVDWTPLARIGDMRDSGVREVSATTAAELLKLTFGHVCNLLGSGRLNGEKRGRKRWIDLQEVENYARDQAHWSGLSGAWTPYGKQELQGPHGDMRLISPARASKEAAVHSVGCGAPNSVEVPSRGWDERIDSKRAADILCVSAATVQRMARSGKLASVKIARRDPHGSCPQRITRIVLSFSLSDVLAMADRREQAAWRRAISPRVWDAGSTRKPVIRTKIEAPSGDRLISPEEAAEVLGISRRSVNTLVEKARLFGWQTHPGRQGCRLFLSERQVLRYRDDPDRLKRRTAQGRGGRPRGVAIPFGEETESDLWREDVGLALKVHLAGRSNLEREHGEFFNARQAAQVLGISVGSMHALRLRGRIGGYQKARIKENRNGNKWWFYRKDDVYGLLADGEYVRHRDRSRRSKLISLGRELPSMETEWSDA